jgi:hypothetical protein
LAPNQALFRQIQVVPQVCFCHLVAAPLAKTHFMLMVSHAASPHHQLNSQTMNYHLGGGNNAMPTGFA